MTNQKRAAKRDIVTLADLSPRREVRGGNGQRVFGADAIDPRTTPNETQDRKGEFMKKTKDLPPKKSPKGGRLAANDNFTLVRAAKPKVKKDLPPKRSPKGGLKML